MLGLTEEFSPRFLRRYHHLHNEMRNAIVAYIADVRNNRFPNEREQY
ncbi:MAG: 3-methyl-2-oxobutanoate hydroxymethyltransferase, partial [Bacteroidales bacterium]